MPRQRIVNLVKQLIENLEEFFFHISQNSKLETQEHQFFNFSRVPSEPEFVYFIMHFICI